MTEVVSAVFCVIVQKPDTISDLKQVQHDKVLVHQPKRSRKPFTKQPWREFYKDQSVLYNVWPWVLAFPFPTHCLSDFLINCAWHCWDLPVIIRLNYNFVVAVCCMCVIIKVFYCKLNSVFQISSHLLHWNIILFISLQINNLYINSSLQASYNTTFISQFR